MIFGPPFKHAIVESYLDDKAQTVRCACGRSAQFGRERTYLGVTIERGRALAEFACTGEVIVLRTSLIKEAR